MAFGRVIALAMAVVAAPAVTHAQVPDTVFVNGKIITVDDRFSIAQALAIRGGRIAKVGTSAEIDALKGPRPRDRS
jgi:predicted amidohydrolase YtcJ